MTDRHYFAGVLQESGTTIEEEASVFGYTDVLFVSPDGNNTDGTTWTNAYTTLPAALAETDSDSNSMTLVEISPGTHDMDVTSDPTYAVNVHLRGAGKHLTIIKNDNGGATAVLKFTSFIKISDLTIDCGTGEDGIILNGTGSNGSELKNIYIECDQLGGAADGIQLSGGVKFLEFHDVEIHGETTNTTGILTNQSSENEFHNIHIHDCLEGFNFTHTDDHDNQIKDALIEDCTTGIITIAGADNNHVISAMLVRNTTNVSDAGAGTKWGDIDLHIENPEVYPITTSTGIELTSGTANSWDTTVKLIMAADVMTTPFKIIGLMIDSVSANVDMYFIRVGPGTNGQAALDSIDVADGFHGGVKSIPAIPVTSGWIAPGQEIAGEIMSESGADTVDVWLIVVQMG